LLKFAPNDGLHTASKLDDAQIEAEGQADESRALGRGNHGIGDIGHPHT